MKRTKIICTIGPASEDPKILTKMIQNGMNVARLNFSHGTYENHTTLMANIRAVSAKLKIPVAIMQDLQGPKIRISEMPKPQALKMNQKVVVGEDFTLDFDITHSVKPKENILIEDGLIELLVTKVTPSKAGKPHTGKIYCTVIAPGTVRSHKGVNLPRSQVTFPILTNKDIQDLKFGLQSDVDYVALSFVRNAGDIQNIKNLIKKYTPKGKELPKVVAKIERSEAVKNFDSILELTDAVMVARGDLGVEMADSQVPLIQKDLIARCSKVGKPVIVATQMLDSMIRNPRPTRAEVSDVANAVIDKADAVMLSGESAFGNYPVQAVMEMDRIIEATEASPYDDALVKDFAGKSNEDKKAALIAGAVHQLSLGVDATTIIGTSESGYTARFVSRERPQKAVLLLTDRPKVYRQMCLFWGVTPLYVKNTSDFKNFETLLNYFVSEAKKLKMIKKGDKAVLVAGRPLGERMNLVQVVTVK
jgi:pyruvate kinase